MQAIRVAHMMRCVIDHSWSINRTAATICDYFLVKWTSKFCGTVLVEANFQFLHMLLLLKWYFSISGY